MPAVVHVVLLRLREETDVITLFRELASLRHRIPGLLSFSGGENNSPEGISRGFTHAFSMTFESPEARDAYLPHPEHERVKALVLAAIAPGETPGVCAVDYAL